MLRLLQKHTVRPGQMKEIQARLRGDEPTPVTRRVASPALGATRDRAAPQSSGARARRRPGPSPGLSPLSGLSGVRRTTSTISSATSSATSGGASSLRRAGSLGNPAVSSASRAHAASLLARPATVAGGERPIARSLSGGAAPADPDDPPPYGRATGVVPRIAEGAPPRAAHVDSDRELSNEIDRVAEQLDPKHEWTDRIRAMTRVEALLLGGAAEWDAFPAQLAKLRGPLTAQVADRRSSIVRQAAHLLVILSAELGGEFEKEAAHFVPELFKCVVITVQIIAESGDHGIRGVLHNCQARQLVPRLCEAASRDRSVKLRCHATGWLRVIVREWDALGGARNQECVEEALKAMVADGSPDVRAGARKLFSAYRERYPEGAARVAGRLDANTKRLIAREAAAGVHDDDERERAASALLARRPRTAATKARPGPTETRELDRPSTVAASGGRRAGVEASRDSGLGVARVGGGAERASARAATTSGVAERANRVGSVGGMATTASRAAAAAARRASAIGGVSDVSGTLASGASGGRSRAPNAATTRERSLGATEATEGAVPASRRPASRERRARAAASAPRSRRRRSPRSVAGIRSSASPFLPRSTRRWRSARAARRSTARGAGRTRRRRGRRRRRRSTRWPPRCAPGGAGAPRRRPRARASWRTPSSRTWATRTTASRTPCSRRWWRLFRRRARARARARAAVPAAVPAAGGLQGERARARVGGARRGGRRLPRGRHPALAARVAGGGARARAKTGVLEFALYVLSGQGGGTRPGAATASPASAGSAALRRWVARVAPLVSDRHAPLRAAAAAGLAAVHARADPVAVLKHLAAMPLGEAAATCRAVAQHAPAVEREFHAYVAAERRAAERAAAEAEAQYAAGRAHAISGLEPEEEGFSAEEEREESLSFSAEREASPPPAASEEASRRRAEEKALVEKARRLRDSQRREEEAARRSADEVAVFEEERRFSAAEEDRMEAQEERRSAEKFSDGLDGLDGSDASVSVSDSVEIEHPPRAEDAEDEKRASPASSTRAKPLETESAAVRAYRESRAAADASVERLAAARATLAAAASDPPPAKASPRARRRRAAASSSPSRSPAKPTASPALAEALASLRDAPGDAASPGTRARALASIRRVLRGGAAVTAEEARVVVAAATPRAVARRKRGARRARALALGGDQDARAVHAARSGAVFARGVRAARARGAPRDT